MERDRAMEICERALAASAADQTTVHLGAGTSALTRFANNRIHQNVAEEGAGLEVRAFLGQRTGIATGNDLSDSGVRDTVARATELARLAEPDEKLGPLPAPQEIPQEVCGVAATANFGADERAAAVRAIIAVAEDAGQTASGACSVGVSASATRSSANSSRCPKRNSAA